MGHMQEAASTRPPRFYVTERLTANSAVLLEGDEGRHATRALRLKEGDALELCDGRGTTVACVISAIEKKDRAWVRAAGCTWGWVLSQGLVGHAL